MPFLTSYDSLGREGVRNCKLLTSTASDNLRLQQGMNKAIGTSTKQDAFVPSRSLAPGRGCGDGGRGGLDPGSDLEGEEEAYNIWRRWYAWRG